MSEGASEVSQEEYLSILGNSTTNVDVHTVIETASRAADEVLGLEGDGLEVWNSVTLPQAQEVYAGSNPTKLARKLLKIIDEAGAQSSTTATVEYLKNAVPSDEVEFAKSDKEAHTQELITDIEKFMVEFAQRYGEGYKGPVAVIVWGSYARFQQRLDSDVDYSVVMVDDPDGFLHKDQWVDSDAFESFLSSKIGHSRKQPIDTQVWGTAALADENSIRDLIEVDSPHFLIASPFPGVKEKVQKLLQSQITEI